MNAPERTDLTAAHPSGSASALPRWREPTLMGTLLSTLGSTFATQLPATPLPELHWVARSDALAQELGLSDWLTSDDALALLGGNAQPAVGASLASVYSGHQFGVWAGQLGDGRALLLGELDTPAGVMELQLKGAGPTPYSRRADGRAVLRSSIREFLASEAMHALGICTTRALAVVGSRAPVRRETVETAAVVARVAPSFIRFGHFEHFAHTAQNTVALQALADAVIDHFYPECRSAARPVLALLEAVARRTAVMLAGWQAVGFCHGVMNTDNLSILGLTIDYGPFGFLDAFDPGHICNHTDAQGRYAFARQPSVGFWNLHALAQAFLPLLGGDIDSAKEAIDPYKTVFADTLQARMRAKLGWVSSQAGDADLIDDLLRLMAQDRCDYTRTMRALSGFVSEMGDQGNASPPADNTTVRDQFINRDAFAAWATRYTQRLRAEASIDSVRAARMNRVNPKFVLRNHLAESAIRLAQNGDFTEVQRLLQVLQQPFDEHPEAPAAYAALPPDWANQLEVSCSS